MKTKLGEMLLEQAVDLGGIPPSEVIELEQAGGPEIGEVHTLLFSGDSIFLSDEFNHRVICYDHKGRLIRVLGGEGDKPGRLRYPKGLAVLDDRLWVCDSLNNRIQVFDSLGKQQHIFSGSDSAFQFYEPVDVRAIDCIACVVNKRTSEFTILDKDGSMLASWTNQPNEEFYDPSNRISFETAVYSVSLLERSHSPASAWRRLRQAVLSGNVFWGLCGDRLEVYDGSGSAVTAWPFPPLVGERGLSTAGRGVVFLEETTGGLAFFNLEKGGILLRLDSRLKGCGAYDEEHVAALSGNRILVWPVETLKTAGEYATHEFRCDEKVKIPLAIGSLEEAGEELEALLDSQESVDYGDIADPTRWYYNRPPKNNRKNLLGFAARRARFLARQLSEAVTGVLKLDKIYSTLLSPRYAYLTVVPYRNATLPAWLLDSCAREETLQVYSTMRNLSDMKQLIFLLIRDFTGEKILRLSEDIPRFLGESLSDLIETAKLAIRERETALKKSADLSTGFSMSCDKNLLVSLSDECARYTVYSQVSGFIAGFCQGLWSRLPEIFTEKMPHALSALFDQAKARLCSIECCFAYKEFFENESKEESSSKKSVADDVLDQLADSIVEVCILAEEVFEAKSPRDIDLRPLVRASWRHNMLTEELRSAGHFDIPEMVKMTAVGGAAQLKAIGREGYIDKLEPYLPTTEKEQDARPVKDAEQFREELKAITPLVLSKKNTVKETSAALLAASGGDINLLHDAVVDLAYVLPFRRHQNLLRDLFERLNKQSSVDKAQLRLATLGSALAWHGGEQEESSRWEKHGLEMDRLAAISQLGEILSSLGYREKAVHYLLSEYLSTLSPSARLAELLSHGQLSPGELAAFLQANRHRIDTDNLFRVCNCGVSDWKQLEVIRREILDRLEVETGGGHAETREYIAYSSAFGGFAENEAIYQHLLESGRASPALPLERARNAAGRGEREYALELLDRFEKEHEVTLPSLNLKSICAKQIGDYQQSEAAALARVNLGEHPDTLILNSALTCLWQGEPRNALELAESIPAESPLMLQREFVRCSVLLTLSEFETVIDSLSRLIFDFKRNPHLLWLYAQALMFKGESLENKGGFAPLLGLRGLHTHRLAASALHAFQSNAVDVGRRLAALAFHRNPSLTLHFLAPPFVDSFNTHPPQDDDIRAIKNLAERFPAMTSVRYLSDAVKAWNDKSLLAKLVQNAGPADDKENAFCRSLLGQVALHHGELETARKLSEPLVGRFGLYSAEKDLEKLNES